jgi:tyrosine-protein phosphatase YwqE
MGIFSFLQSKREPAQADLSVLEVDVHSHLLPGIDDGAKTLDHSLGMLRKFEELGYKKLITTPHVMDGVYRNTQEIILGKLSEVRGAAKEAGLTIELEASAEYFYDDTLFERLRKDDLMPFAGNHILFECSFRNEPAQLEEFVFALATGGYQPVIAHFERYPYYHGSTDFAQRLRDMGCWIQLNINSLTGHYGPEIKKQGLRLVKEGLVDLAGSDCHRMEHLEMLEKHLGDEAFHQLLALPLKNKSLA